MDSDCKNDLYTLLKKLNEIGARFFCHIFVLPYLRTPRNSIS
jgi:hypothetical protein